MYLGGVQTLELELLFVGMFNCCCTYVGLQNVGLIKMIFDKLVYVDSITQRDINDISSFRASLDRSELVWQDVQSVQKCHDFFIIKSTALPFIILQSNFQCVSLVHFDVFILATADQVLTVSFLELGIVSPLVSSPPDPAMVGSTVYTNSCI